ncbi:MAG: EamA family transporter RarD [Bdellovibrionota bacterium]
MSNARANPSGSNDGQASSERTGGSLYALGAFLAWGLFPIYWKWLGAFPAIELIAHRIVFAFVFYWLFTLKNGSRAFAWLDLFRDRRQGLAIIAATVLLTTNWILYVWAVNDGHVVEASLGYFITPLLNVLSGFLFLKEKLSRARWTAIALAAAGVLVLAVQGGTFPWISVSIALTFSMYGLIRKQLKANVFATSTAETGVLLVPALLYVIYERFFDMTAHQASLGEAGLLVLSGVITGLPLIWFAQAARRLPLSSLAFFQYIAPSIQFLLGVVAYQEPFDITKLQAFALIWAALAIFSWDSFRKRPGPRAITPPE